MAHRTQPICGARLFPPARSRPPIRARPFAPAHSRPPDAAVTSISSLIQTCPAPTIGPRPTTSHLGRPIGRLVPDSCNVLWVIRYNSSAYTIMAIKSWPSYKKYVTTPRPISLRPWPTRLSGPTYAAVYQHEDSNSRRSASGHVWVGRSSFLLRPSL